MSDLVNFQIVNIAHPTRPAFPTHPESHPQIHGLGIADAAAFDGYGRGVGNLSVHSGTSATFRQKPAPPAPKLEKEKV